MDEERKYVKTSEILLSLPKLFSSLTVSKVARTPANVFLHNAQGKGYIKKIANKAYINYFRSGENPAVEAVTCFVKPMSYISCEWALHFHSVILQTPKTCTAMTLSSNTGKRFDIDYLDFRIEFSKTVPKLFNNFTDIVGDDGTVFAIACPEKALIDCVNLRGAVPFADELQIENLNIDKLRELSLMYSRTVQDKTRLWIDRYASEPVEATMLYSSALSR